MGRMEAIEIRGRDAINVRQKVYFSILYDMKRMKQGVFRVRLVTERNDCEFSNWMSEHSIDAHILQMNIGDGHTTHIFEMDKKRLKELKFPKNYKVAGNGIVLVRTPSCDVCSKISESGGLVSRIFNIKRRRFDGEILLPNSFSVRSLKKNLETEGIEYSLVNERELIGTSYLTRRQAELLYYSFKAGYFDPDPRISLTEMAKKLKISPSSLSETLNRGIAKLIKNNLNVEK